MKFHLCILISIGLLGAAQSLAKSRPETPLPLKVDSYGDVTSKEEKARLDGFVAALRKEPFAQGYIMVYAGNRARRGEAAARGRRAKEYLVKKRGIVAERIVAVDAGYREKLAVELWVIRPGGTSPPQTPTIDPGEVQIIDGRVKGRRPI